MWIPSSLGTWSRTITRPTPALKPVSTGTEMKLATNPRRISLARSSIAPTSAVKVAVAVTSFAGSPSGTARPSCVPARIAERGGGADAEHARRAEQRVDQHGDERGIQADRNRQAGNRRVGHRFRQHNRRGRQAGDQVEAQCGGAGLACFCVCRMAIHAPNSRLLREFTGGQLPQ